jgi:hypothetical protein
MAAASGSGSVVFEVMVIIYLHLSLERLYGAVWLALAQRGVMDRSVSSSVMYNVIHNFLM